MNVQCCTYSPAVENDAGPGKMTFVCLAHQVKILGDEAMLAGWIQIARVSHHRGRSSSLLIRIKDLGIMSTQIIVPQTKHPTPPCLVTTAHSLTPLDMTWSLTHSYSKKLSGTGIVALVN